MVWRGKLPFGHLLFLTANYTNYANWVGVLVTIAWRRWLVASLSPIKMISAAIENDLVLMPFFLQVKTDIKKISYTYIQTRQRISPTIFKTGEPISPIELSTFTKEFALPFNFFESITSPLPELDLSRFKLCVILLYWLLSIFGWIFLISFSIFRISSTSSFFNVSEVLLSLTIFWFAPPCDSVTLMLFAPVLVICFVLVTNLHFW